MYPRRLRMVAGKNMRMMPSPLTMGTMICVAPLNTFKPSQQRSGVGNGTSKRPIPNTATAKKCVTKLRGFGSNPESKAMGPRAYPPPSLRYWKHALRISSIPEFSDFVNTLYKALAKVFMVNAGRVRCA